MYLDILCNLLPIVNIQHILNYIFGRLPGRLAEKYQLDMKKHMILIRNMVEPNCTSENMSGILARICILLRKWCNLWRNSRRNL